jgi:hypothetical protein
MTIKDDIRISELLRHMNDYYLNDNIEKWRAGKVAIVFEFVKKPFDDCSSVLTISEHKTLLKRAERILDKANKKFLKEKYGKRPNKEGDHSDLIEVKRETDMDKLNNLNMLNERHISLLNKKISSLKESMTDTMNDLHSASILAETSFEVEMKPSYSKVLQDGSLAFININKMKLSAITSGYNPKRIASKLNSMKKREWEELIIKEGVLFKQAAESKGNERLKNELHNLRIKLEEVRKLNQLCAKDKTNEKKSLLEESTSLRSRIQYSDNDSDLVGFDENDKKSDVSIGTGSEDNISD